MPWQDVVGTVFYPRVSLFRPGDLTSGPQGNDSIDETGALRRFASTELPSHTSTLGQAVYFSTD